MGSGDDKLVPKIGRKCSRSRTAVRVTTHARPVFTARLLHDQKVANAEKGWFEKTVSRASLARRDRFCTLVVGE